MAGGGGGGVGYGGIATMAGGIMQSIAAAQAQQAMYDEYKKELKRQGVYQQQSYDAFGKNTTQSGAANTKAEMGAATQKRESQYAGAAEKPLGIYGTPSVGTDSARDAAAVADAGARRAALGSYGDAGFSREMGNIGTGRELGRIGNFSEGENRLYPYRMYDAQNTLWQLALAGKLLSSIGNLSGDISSVYKGYAAPSQPGFGQAPQGVPNANPYGDLPAYQNSQAFTDAYGNYYPPNWQQLGGAAEGKLIPG
jgi:hypothetical protein